MQPSLWICNDIIFCALFFYHLVHTIYWSVLEFLIVLPVHSHSKFLEIINNHNSCIFCFPATILYLVVHSDQFMIIIWIFI